MLKDRLTALLRGNKATARAPTSGMTRPEPRAPFPDAGPGARVTLWVESWCSDSRKAERYCLEQGWPTHREDLAGRHAERAELLKTHGRRLLPLVYVDGVYLGGLAELQKLTSLPLLH